ncbi:hypothetical protein OPIT5_17840 [Opitutaceae bacterium TAV5]|nr:hypothetical protein OPIT5_17840 [Opitutaceae bacterium TAV5]
MPDMFPHYFRPHIEDGRDFGIPFASTKPVDEFRLA